MNMVLLMLVKASCDGNIWAVKHEGDGL